MRDATPLPLPRAVPPARAAFHYIAAVDPKYTKSYDAPHALQSECPTPFTFIIMPMPSNADKAPANIRVGGLQPQRSVAGSRCAVSTFVPAD